MAISPPMLLSRTIRPAPWVRMAGSSSAVTRTHPQKMVSIWARASSSVVVSTGPASPQPAQATSAST